MLIGISFPLIVGMQFPLPWFSKANSSRDDRRHKRSEMLIRWIDGVNTSGLAYSLIYRSRVRNIFKRVCWDAKKKKKKKQAAS
jgi:hypothetical protein